MKSKEKKHGPWGVRKGLVAAKGPLAHDPPILARVARAEDGRPLVGRTRLLLLPPHLGGAARPRGVRRPLATAGEHQHRGLREPYRPTPACAPTRCREHLASVVPRISPPPTSHMICSCSSCRPSESWLAFFCVNQISFFFLVNEKQILGVCGY